MDAESKLDMNLLKEMRDFGAYGSAVPVEHGNIIANFHGERAFVFAQLQT